MYAELLFYYLIVSLVVGSIIAFVLHPWPRYAILASFTIAMTASVAGLLLSIEVITTGSVHIELYSNMFFGSWGLEFDRLGGFFLLIVSLVMTSVSIYSIGYMKEYEGKYDLSVMGGLFNLFFLSLIVVIAADNIVLFLIAWESMSLLSYLLVVYEHRKEGVAGSGYLYLVMTHLGTALIIISFLIMANYSDSYSFSDLQGIGGAIPDVVRSSLFIMLFIGFGTKAGIVPLHIWLPSAHPAAPSNISAVMSGVMVKMALLMLVRSYFEYLGVIDSWWGLLILIVGSISALLGVLYALQGTDLKSILAYSTVENMGIIMVGLGASMLFLSYGLNSLSALALIATLFHALNHAIFKALLFLGAGSVLYGTHTRDMESLGGLVRTMPRTSVLVFIGVMSLAAIPPLGGFVGEWLIFQSLLQSFNIPEIGVKILIPISIAMLALTGALAAALSVRFFGITFLSLPRSEQAAHSKESPGIMLWAMTFLAILCVGLGIFSFWLIPYIDVVTTSILGVSTASSIVDGLVLSPGNSNFAQMAPSLIGVLMLIVIPVTYAASRYYGGQQKKRTSTTWDCGTPLNPRNQYTGTAFSNPIVRVFSYIFRDQTEIRTEYTSSPYVKKRISYHQRIVPVFEKYLYRPVVNIGMGAARRVTIIQTGNIQAYLAYIFAILVLLLVIFR